MALTLLHVGVVLRGVQAEAEATFAASAIDALVGSVGKALHSMIMIKLRLGRGKMSV